MTNVPFTPLFARVLLKRDRVSKVGSIILPDTATNKYNPEEGILIAVGHTVDDTIRELLNRKVMFAKYSGAWIKIQEEEYFMCQEEDLLGVVYE